MDVTGIKRSCDWPFVMPAFTAEAIDDLVAAMARDDVNLDCYQDEVEGAARGVAEEHDRELYDYYLRGGYRADLAG